MIDFENRDWEVPWSLSFKVTDHKVGTLELFVGVGGIGDGARE